MKKFLMKIPPTAKRVAPVLTVLLLIAQIPNAYLVLGQRISGVFVAS